jgi:urease accessory protein
MNLQLLQISDSALPIGGYTHSWGLEAAIARGLVSDSESLERWTSLWLRASLGPLEGVLVRCAFQAVRLDHPNSLASLNQLAEASIVAPTIRLASREMGEQLLQLASTWVWSAAPLTAILDVSQSTGEWHHSVAFGLLGAIAGGDEREVLTAYLHQAALGMIGAAVRGVPIGHTNGQQVLAYLQQDIQQLVAALLGRGAETAGAGCPF